VIFNGLSSSADGPAAKFESGLTDMLHRRIIMPRPAGHSMSLAIITFESSERNRSIKGHQWGACPHAFFFVFDSARQAPQSDLKPGLRQGSTCVISRSARRKSWAGFSKSRFQNDSQSVCVPLISELNTAHFPAAPVATTRNTATTFRSP